MATHEQRLQAAREAIDFICIRSDTELQMPVPHCPGWTIYNAATHVGRVAVAWKSMIDATPDDPDSRARGYADAEARGSGQSTEELAAWGHAAIDSLEDDLDRAAYFSMTGGHGTVAMWGWHAASELGLHRLDVEHALGVPYSLSDEMAIDSLAYTCEHFLPAMARAAARNPDPVRLVVKRDDTTLATMTLPAVADEVEAAATVSGEPVDVLLSLWGRSHGDLDVSGDAAIVNQWQSLPGEAFQFGTWD